jgi:hypothetical protein
MWVCGSLSTFEEQGLSNPVPTSLVSKGEKACPSWKVGERLEQIIRQVVDEFGI